MVSSSSCGLNPSPTDSEPCGSKSTSSTRRPYSASAAPRLMVVVVLPTPPFWLHIAMTRAGPCSVRAGGSGRYGIGRPVGPNSPSEAAGSTSCSPELVGHLVTSGSGGASGWGGAAVWVWRTLISCSWFGLGTTGLGGIDDAAAPPPE